MSGAEAAASARSGIAAGKGWRAALWRLAALSLFVLALFWRDAADMARIWWDVSTYNHVLLIPPIIAWLVSQRMAVLREVEPRAWLLPLGWVAGAALLWLLGQAGEIALFRHAALVAMLQGATAATLGPRATKVLLFPIAYALFCIPVGEELVPYLQTVTADISMVMLEWSGVPAHIEGVFISTPTAYFEVAEACSGVKFLIAMIAYGVLVCHVCFKGWLRRALFLAACVAVPILANGVRAWGTMYIAHRNGIEFAAGFDHVVYGWFFFALVLAILMGGAWRYFDRSPGDLPDFGLKPPPPASGANGWAVAGVAAALVLAPVLWAMAAFGASAGIPARIALPDIPGWERIEPAQRYAWKPRQDGAAHTLFGGYRTADGARVELYAALYDRQQEGGEMVGYAQGPHDPATKWSWTEPGAPVANGNAIRIVAPGPVTREAVTFYRIGDDLTGSGARVKLATLVQRLTGSPEPGLVLIVSAEEGGRVPARDAIDRLLADAGGAEKLTRGIVRGVGE